jgi:hypothetical protein
MGDTQLAPDCTEFEFAKTCIKCKEAEATVAVWMAHNRAGCPTTDFYCGPCYLKKIQEYVVWLQGPSIICSVCHDFVSKRITDNIRGMPL